MSHGGVVSLLTPLFPGSELGRGVVTTHWMEMATRAGLEVESAVVERKNCVSPLPCFFEAVPVNGGACLKVSAEEEMG